MEIRLQCPVITVGGTNGKGSTCAMLESILRAAGYRTGLYTSPHLVRYNERVRIAGAEAGDRGAVRGVRGGRGGARRSAADLFRVRHAGRAFGSFTRAGSRPPCSRSGLGGRLDAVNAIDADCAVLTSVGIDHVDYLGADRESIGREKAGIFRADRPAVIAEPDPPHSVRGAVGNKLFLGQDFGFERQESQWAYWGPRGKRSGLAHPALRGGIQLRNAARGAVRAGRAASSPVAMQEVRRGLAEVTLPGRFQVLPGRPQVILDVAHNVEAARNLADNLAASGFAPETIAVCGMLRDKDIAGVLRALAPRITRWHLASLPGPRARLGGRPANEISHRRAAHTGGKITLRRPMRCAAALERAEESDKIVVFGSFLTVGEAMAWLKNNNKTSKR